MNALKEFSPLMQLAFSTNAYLNYSFDDAVSRLATIGYRGVEVMADVPHAWPAYLLPEQKQSLRDASPQESPGNLQRQRSS